MIDRPPRAGRSRDRAVRGNRAVSEVIAFVLVFAIVITSIGLLYTVGFGSLNQLQQTEQDDSGEAAMRAMAVALDDVQAGRGAVRSAELRLGERTITVDDSTELSVSVDGGTSWDTASGAFVYTGGDSEIVYQSGAVIRSQGDDAQLVQRGPRFRCAEDHAVVSLVDLTQAESGAYSSGGRVRIRAEQQNSRAQQVVAQAPSGGVTVDFGSSNYVTAWERYFEDEGWNIGPSGTTAECDSNSEGVYVRMTELEFEYQGV